MELERKQYSTAIQHVDIIISEIANHIYHKQDFISFIIIALGIEFLGNFFDEKDFNDFGQSKIRFKNAISNLFKNNWYKNNSEWLFENFRGPLIHQYRVGSEILLTSNCKNGAPLSDHLQMKDNKRIFVIEQLFVDFKLAADRLKNLAEKDNQLIKDKITKEYLTIFKVKSFPKAGTNINQPYDSSGSPFL